MSNSVSDILRKLADQIDEEKKDTVREIAPIFKAIGHKKQCKYCLDMIEHFTYCVGKNVYCLKCAHHLLERKTGDINFIEETHEKVIKNLDEVINK